jgi:hypothetical protein
VQNSQADTETDAEIRNVGRDELAEPAPLRRNRGGSTIRPRYGERRPMTYHLFETEFKSISALNGEALRWFSIGTFALSIFMNIVVSYLLVSMVPDIAKLLLPYGLLFFGGISVISFFCGGWAIYSKNNIVKDIKNETIERPQ